MAKRTRRKKRKLNRGRLLLLFVIVGLLIYGFLTIRYNNNIKPVQTESEVVLFTVNQGQSTKEIVTNLENEGIIRDANSAYSFAKKNKYNDIKAGDFELDKSWELSQIFDTLSDASKAIAYDATVTIVEGDWCADIAPKIASGTIVTEEELLALWNDRSYIESIMPRYPFLTEEIFKDNVRYYLEGYLAPNTYKFFQDTTATEVTEKILDESLKIYEKYEKEFKKSNLTTHQIYTLASIVQHEANSYETMRMIAQVFYNRLEIDMPLQSSSTTCYAIEEHSGDWVSCEVNYDFDSPYNTYMYNGLPPGAILNPGEQAIEATLNPDTSAKKYFYFMADVEGDGTIYFAETLEEHEANVAKYLR